MSNPELFDLATRWAKAERPHLLQMGEEMRHDLAAFAEHALTSLKSLEGQEVEAWMATIRYPNGDKSERYAATKEGAAQLGYESTRITGTVISVIPLARLTKSANP